MSNKYIKTCNSEKSHRIKVIVKIPSTPTTFVQINSKNQKEPTEGLGKKDEGNKKYKLVVT